MPRPDTKSFFMIAERGTHQELLNLQGYYARLYQRQLLLKEITDWGE